MWLHYCQGSVVKLRAELGSQQSWLLRSLSCSCLKLRCHQKLLQTFLTAHWKPGSQNWADQSVLNWANQSVLSMPPAHCRTNGVSSLIPLGMVSMAKGGSAGLFCWIMFSVIDLLPSQWFFWRLHMLKLCMHVLSMHINCVTLLLCRGKLARGWSVTNDAKPSLEACGYWSFVLFQFSPSPLPLSLQMELIGPCSVPVVVISLTFSFCD